MLGDEGWVTITRETRIFLAPFVIRDDAAFAMNGRVNIKSMLSLDNHPSYNNNNNNDDHDPDEGDDAYP